MKLFNYAAIGLVALTGVAATAPASAQRVVHERTVVRTVHTERGHWRTRKVCENVYRNHHRTRVCRTVRYR